MSGNLPTLRDLIAIALIGASSLAVVLGVTALQRRGGMSAEAGRKAIHVLVGFIPFAAAFALDRYASALLLSGGLVLASLANWRWSLFPAMAGTRPTDLGAVYYPLALTALVALLWHSPQRPVIAVAMGPMIWGDALAAIAGDRPGIHPLVRDEGLRKSWEGAAAMGLATFLGLVVTLPLAGMEMTAASAGFAAAAAALLAAVEAASPAGLDNLSVPWAAAALIVSGAAAPAPAGAAAAVGLLAAALVALVAERQGALDRGGAVGATAVGALVFALGGLRWALPLVGYFIACAAVSRFGRHRKGALDAYAARGERRDIGQVLSNGAVPALAAILGALVSGAPAGSGGAALAAYAGALAASAGDTWATEVGGLSRAQPRLITTRRLVALGTSGGVTALGLAASVAGAGFVALLVAAGLARPGPLLLAALAGGVAGSLVDSLVGATLQAVRWCPACGAETERTVHICGTATRHRRGWRWVGNDAVNVACTACGALAACAAWGALGR